MKSYPYKLTWKSSYGHEITTTFFQTVAKLMTAFREEKQRGRIVEAWEIEVRGDWPRVEHCWVRRLVS